MPPAIIAAAAVIGAGAAATAVNLVLFTGVFAFAVGPALISLGVTLALGSVAQALQSKPKGQSGESVQIAQTISGRTVSIRQAIQAHRIIYGEVRVGGAITFVDVTDTSPSPFVQSGENIYLHQLVTIAGHPISEFVEWMIDDQTAVLDSGGLVTAGIYKVVDGIPTPGGLIQAMLEYILRNASRRPIKIRGGLGTTAGDSTLLTELTAASPLWTTNHKQEERAKFYVQFEYTPDLFFQIPNITAFVRGKKVLDFRDSVTKWHHNPALILYDYLVNTDYGLAELAARINASGTFTTAANICEERVSVRMTRTFTVDTGTDEATLSSSSLGARTGDAVTLTNSGGALPAGLSAGTTYYLIVSSSTVVQFATTEANAIAGTQIDITGAGTGTHTMTRETTQTFTADASTDVVTVAAQLRNIQTGDGVRVSNSGGALPAGLSAATTYYWSRVSRLSGKLATSYANALAGTFINITDAGTGTHTIQRWDEPRYTCNGTFDSDQEPLEIINQLLSAMRGSLIYQGGQWNLYAGAYRTPTVTLDEDDLIGGMKVTPRISRRELFNGVKGVFSSPEDLSQPTDFPAVTNSTYLTEDNSEELFKDVQFNFTTSPTMAQRIAKIDLEAARQQITVEVVANLNAMQLQAGDTVQLTNTRMGWASKVFDVMHWELASQTDEKGMPVYGVGLKLRETASAVYDWDSGEEQRVDPAPNTNLPDPFTVTVPSGLTLESGTNALFLKGDGTVVSRIKITWTDSTDAFIRDYKIEFKKSADSIWESIPSVENAQQIAYIWEVDDGTAYDVRIKARNTLGVSSAWVTETNHTVIGKTAVPANVTGFSIQQNGNVSTFKWLQVSDIDLSGYEIRYGAQGALTWSSGTTLTKITKGTLVTNAALPPGSWTVGIKAVDTTGNESTTEATFDIDITNENDIIYNTDEHPRWTGTLSNFIKHDVSSRLVPDSQSLADAVGFEIFDQFVYNPQVICTYTAKEIDVGFDAPVRVWSEMLAALGPGESSVADPQLSIDYKLAAGAYDGFEDWTIGNITARYVKHKLTIDTSTGIAYAEEFTPVVDVEERTETGSNAVIAAGGTAITFTQQFNTAPVITVTPIDASNKLFPVITVKSTTGFTVKVFNDAGTDVGGTIDWIAIGA